MGEPVAPLRPEDPGAVGRYRLLGVLGVGGMGTVYLAAAPDERRVAVKVINPAWHHDPQFRHRFAAEAAAASRVAGFCTARVLDVALDGPVPHLVTEYVQGPSLHDYATANGPLAGQVEAVAVGVAAALTAIHAVGLVHGDLSPRNVLLSPFGPKVIDFGVARPSGQPHADGHSAGHLFATPGWLAPEQRHGAPPSQASDVYVWGLLVAWAGTGRMPFAGDGGRPDLAGLAADLAAVVRRALRSEPRDRPTARQVLLALVGQDDPAAVRLPSATAPVARPHARPHPGARTARVGGFVPGAAAVPAPVSPTIVDPTRSGSAFTTGVHDPGRRPRSPGPLPPVPPPPRRPPRRVARGVFSGLGLLLALGCLLGVLHLADSAGQDDESGAAGPSANAKPASPKPSPVATSGKLRFTVERFSCATAELGQWPVTRAPQGQFCLVALRVDNVGQGSGRVWLGSQRLRDTSDKEYKPDEWSWLYYDGTRPLLNEIKAGGSVQGTLVFDVPTGLTFDELVVKEQPLSAGSPLRLP